MIVLLPPPPPPPTCPPPPPPPPPPRAPPPPPTPQQLDLQPRRRVARATRPGGRQDGERCRHGHGHAAAGARETQGDRPAGGDSRPPRRLHGQDEAGEGSRTDQTGVEAVGEGYWSCASCFLCNLYYYRLQRLQRNVPTCIYNNMIRAHFCIIICTVHDVNF